MRINQDVDGRWPCGLEKSSSVKAAIEIVYSYLTFAETGVHMRGKLIICIFRLATCARKPKVPGSSPAATYV